MTPVFEELSDKWAGKIVFLKIDIDKSEVCFSAWIILDTAVCAEGTLLVFRL